MIESFKVKGIKKTILDAQKELDKAFRNTNVINNKEEWEYYKKDIITITVSDENEMENGDVGTFVPFAIFKNIQPMIINPKLLHIEHDDEIVVINDYYIHTIKKGIVKIKISIDDLFCYTEIEVN